MMNHCATLQAITAVQNRTVPRVVGSEESIGEFMTSEN
jgi:hypothetical protein